MKRYVLSRTPHWVDSWVEVEVDPAECGPGEDLDARTVSVMLNGEHKPVGRTIGDEIPGLNDPDAGAIITIVNELPDDAAILHDAIGYLQEDREEVFACVSVEGRLETIEPDDRTWIDRRDQLIERLRSLLG